MKQKISVSIEKETVELVERFVREGRFRNISHALEYGFNQLVKGEKNE